MKKFVLALSLAALLGLPFSGAAQEFSVDVNLRTRGEVRAGGLPEGEGEKSVAAFLSERTRLPLQYSRPHLDIRVVGQHSGVWGQAGGGAFSLYEAWVQVKADMGLFAKIGRQELSYDNGRIIGSDDWAMAVASHDILKLGYEGHGHKAHLLLGFNQNAENVTGGTYYVNGGQHYKSMQTLWYHYDIPRTSLGASLLFMNVGTQNEETRSTEYQQLAGTYLLWQPERWMAEASYYYQFGKTDTGMPISAWMAAAKVQFKPWTTAKFTAGYDYLSGDEFYYVRSAGSIGLVRHEVLRGFYTLYGSHHQFYGAMDFFYMSAFTDGFTPGLQNAFLGANYYPIPQLDLSLTAHYLAITAPLQNVNPTLGAELEFAAAWTPRPDIELSFGYTFMQGTETMELLKRSTDKKRLHWVYLQLVVKPRLFTTRKK